MVGERSAEDAGGASLYQVSRLSQQRLHNLEYFKHEAGVDTLTLELSSVKYFDLFMCLIPLAAGMLC